MDNLAACCITCDGRGGRFVSSLKRLRGRMALRLTGRSVLECGWLASAHSAFGFFGHCSGSIAASKSITGHFVVRRGIRTCTIESGSKKKTFSLVATRAVGISLAMSSVLVHFHFAIASFFAHELGVLDRAHAIDTIIDSTRSTTDPTSKERVMLSYNVDPGLGSNDASRG